MIIIEEDGVYKLKVNKEEIAYNLERLLKVNNDQLKLTIDEIKKISDRATKDLMNPKNYPIFSTNNGGADEFYKAVESYWFKVCQHEIDSENYKQ